MSRKQRSIIPWVAGLFGLCLALVIVLFALTPAASVLYGLVRATALIGYLFIFVAVVSSAYMRELVRAFGQSFVKTHHWLSVTGLVLVTLHPIFSAWNAGSLDVFIPAFDSWSTFWALAGRPAWYLFVLAAVTAAFRQTLRNSWRLIHYLNYIAFIFATVHGTLSGTDLAQFDVLRYLSYLLALIAVGVFAYRRYQAWQRGQRRRSS